MKELWRRHRWRTVFVFCLIFLATPHHGLATEFLGPYLDQWESLSESELDDITWERPRRSVVSPNRIRIELGGTTRNFKNVRLTPVMMMAELDAPKKYRSEDIRLALTEYTSLELGQDGRFWLSLDLRPGHYRLHLTFETITQERLSYLVVLEVKSEGARLRRYSKTTHNLGIERFLTYEEILERADHEAYEQTENIEEKMAEIYRRRRRNYLFVGLGGALSSFSQSTEVINARTNFTSYHIPLLHLGVEYSSGRDLFLKFDLNHVFHQEPDTDPFGFTGPEEVAWSGQTLAGHYILPFWGRRFDFIFGLHRTSIPYFVRDTRRTLTLEKSTLLTTLVGLNGRWFVNENTELALQGVIRPILGSSGESEPANQFYYGVHFSLIRNLNFAWRFVVTGGFDKYSGDRLLLDQFDGQQYTARQSLVQPHLLFKIGRSF